MQTDEDTNLLGSQSAVSTANFENKTTVEIPNELLLLIFQHGTALKKPIMEPHFKDWSLVCKTWYAASADDTIWKQKLQFSFDLKLPSKHFKASFIQHKKRRKKEQLALQRQEEARIKKQKIIDGIKKNHSKITALINAVIFIAGLLFLGSLVVMHQVTTIPNYYFAVMCGAPLLVLMIGIYANLLFDFMVSHWNTRQIGYTYFLAMTMVFFGGVFLTLVLTVINLSLPYISPSIDPNLPYYMYDRRINIIPWYAVLAPLALTCVILALVSTGVLLASFSFKIQNKFRKIGADVDALQQLCLALHGFWFLAILQFCIFITLHLEYPKLFDIAYSFILLWLAELALAGLFIFIWISESRDYKPSCAESIIFLLVILWSVSMGGMQILLCLNRFIHSYVLIPMVVPWSIACLFNAIFGASFEK